MPVEAFLDTNLFIYQIEADDERKASVADKLISDAIRTGGACISFQVVQECLNTVVRKAEIALDTQQALDYLEAVLEPLMQVNASVDLYARTVQIQSRYQFSFYDALMVAAALEAGCLRLLTEDLQHGQELEGLRIENPFL